MLALFVATGMSQYDAGPHNKKTPAASFENAAAEAGGEGVGKPLPTLPCMVRRRRICPSKSSDVRHHQSRVWIIDPCHG